MKPVEATSQERRPTPIQLPRIDGMIDDREETGVFRVHRDVFRDPDIFELEMKHIFESTWVYLCHESEIPNAHDFLTTTIGRYPIIVMRDGDGQIGCFLNSCPHRGALICHVRQGSGKRHICNYHGWTFDSAGQNVLVTNEEEGCYTSAFKAENRDLRPVARLESYRGLVFGSLRLDVPPLQEHLAGAAAFLDLFVDQSVDGIELLPGRVAYTYEGNWKAQVENATDSYHFSITHASYLGILQRRTRRKSKGADGKPADGAVSGYSGLGSNQQKLGRGAFDFGNGHSAIWGAIPNPEARPLYSALDELKARVGETRAKWMFYTRNLSVYPNLQISENIASQLRIVRPIAVDRTEVVTYCIGAKGESAAARRQRLRDYEEFFNPSGTATPDDLVSYQDCQAGFAARDVEWHHYARGMGVLQKGRNEHADELEIDVERWLYGGFSLGDETAHQSGFREWRRLLQRGLGSESSR